MSRLFLSLVLLGLLWAVGFLLFVSRIPAATIDEPFKADGVVVFTGGPARVTAAMAVFEKGAGARLLISGVNPDTSREQLAQVWTGEPDQFECCVDLGMNAQTTEGNADELLEWAQNNKFERVILVTSDYHMPRAIATVQGRVSDVKIVPHVVPSGYLDSSGRPGSANAWRVIAGEYSKFIAARVKAFFSAKR
ncbi:MAG: YdcF family protein [Pseudomonadota bacterium]